MKKALFPTIVLVLGSVALGATVFREQVARAAPGIQDVFVTNSTREPVPVHEQGTAEVNVTNAPLAVHEQGTASVSIDGVPRVEVSEEPFQQTVQLVFNSTVAIGSIQVPEGKRLTIRYVNAADDHAATLTRLYLTSVSPFAQVYAPVIDRPGSHELVSEEVLLYVGPEYGGSVIGGRDAPGNGEVVRVVLTGTLSDG